MNRILRSDTREEVNVGDTIEAGNGWAMKIERLPPHPGWGLMGYHDEEGRYREISLDKVGLEFEHPHRLYLDDSSDEAVIRYDDLVFTVRFTQDDDDSPPWERGDGYGIVSDWTTRPKRPGERVISTADRGDRKRYYDWAGSIERAKIDHWDAPPYETGTKGQRAVRAVEADFKFLKGWCDDAWRFVVIHVKCEGEEDVSGGFETYKDYHVESAWEMIEAMADKVKENRRLADEADAAAERERARLQDLAQQIWNLVTFGVGDKPGALAAVLAEYNQIVVRAGLQPIAIGPEVE
jgi:hypothetical protein